MEKHGIEPGLFYAENPPRRMKAQYLKIKGIPKFLHVRKRMPRRILEEFAQRQLDWLRRELVEYLFAVAYSEKEETVAIVPLAVGYTTQVKLPSSEFLQGFSRRGFHHVLLVHNHPGGHAEFSKEDNFMIDMTQTYALRHIPNTVVHGAVIGKGGIRFSWGRRYDYREFLSRVFESLWE